MRPLSARDVLSIWEYGEGRHPIDQALLVLSAGYPELSADELADLPIGERDARLLELRLVTLGPRLEGSGECPACAEHFEVVVPAAAILVGAVPAGQTPSSTLDEGGMHFALRCPTSRDLAAIAGESDVAGARRELLRRCVTAELDELPEEIGERVAARLLELDPCAETLLDLSCPQCGHAFQLVFDPGSFFWAELAAGARRLLRDVNALASAFGWREEDIVRMSPRRRQAYLAMVES